MFSAQPAINGIFEVGQILALDLGITVPAAALTITRFTLNGVDHTADISGLEWDSSGADISNGGVIEYQVNATNEAGSTASDLVTATLNQPASDTTAPVLSDVSASVSLGSANLNWATNEGDGTAYWICSTSAATPSETQIVAGQDQSGSAAFAGGSYSVTAAGPQATFTASGLVTGVAYFFHLMHKDTVGNQSAFSTTAGITVSNATAVISITRRSRLWVAPDACNFEIAVAGFDTASSGPGDYNPQFHELYYEWDFDDSYTFTAPVNLLPEKKLSGTSFGPIVSHTYRTAGTYTVTCVVTEPSSGKSATATYIVRVGSADTMFSTTKTVFMSPSGDFTDTPTGAVEVTSGDVDSVLRSNILGADTTPMRLMLSRGENYTFSGTSLGTTAGNRVPSLQIVAGAGAGANPAVTCTGGFGWSDNQTTGDGEDKDLTIQNIDWTGPWDSTDESGSDVVMFAIFNNSPNLLLSDGCSFDGFQIAFYITNEANVDHRAVVLNDTSVTNWRDYGISCGAADGGMVMTGSSICCHVDANAGGPKDGNHNAHGPIRHNSSKNLIVTNSEFYSRCGWSTLGAYQSAQPCLRINAGGYEGVKVNIQDCSLEGGYNVMAFSVQGGSTPYAVNAVVEKCYMLGSHQSTGTVSVQMGGVTLRNNVMVQPNTGRLASSQKLHAYVALDGDNGGSENQDTPVKIYSNTCVNLMEDANFGGTIAPSDLTVGSSTFSTVNTSNNVIYQPNTTGGNVSDAPLVTSPSQWIPREKGYKDEATPRIAATATPVSTPASYAPDANSNAIGDALIGLGAYDDFFGNQRPQYPSRGAQERP